MKVLQRSGCLVLLLFSAGVTCAKENPVALLGGQPVYADEYAFHEDQLRTGVASLLMRQHGLTPSDSFWTTEVEGTTPEAILKRETLQRIARYRVVQEWAVELGLIDTVLGYRDLVAAFHQENVRRREMKASGQVFYGPAQFRQDVYFNVRLEQWTRALERALATSDPSAGDDIDEEVLKQRLEEVLQQRISDLLD